MENHYFKTAEFAALCGVRKDTLPPLRPHWPAETPVGGENGYRY